LIENCRKAGRPIIYFQHDGGKDSWFKTRSGGWKIHSSIAPAKRDLIIRKKYSDVFFKTDLDKELKKRKIKRIIVSGIQTEVCVDTACRRAFSHGYEVVLVKDAHSTWNRPPLTARQIIQYHNELLGEWFAKIEETQKIRF
jgi:hypothetical protein